MSTDAQLTSDNESSTQLPSSAQRPRHAVVANGRHTQDNGDDGVSSASVDSDDMPLSQTLLSKAESSSPQVRNRKRKKPVPSEYSSSSDDDVPLASSSPAKPVTKPKRGASKGTAAAVNGTRKSTGKRTKPPAVKEEDEDESESDKKKKKRLPNGTTKSKSKGKRPAKKVKKEESEDDNEEEDDDDIPLAVSSSPPAKRKVAKEAPSEEESPPKKASKKNKVKKEEETGTLKPSRNSKVKKEGVNGSPAKKGRVKGEDAEDVYKWWERDADGDGTIKWQTLEHSGVLFPPPYEPLPKDVKLKYNGKFVDLLPEAEEVAGFYAAMLETDHAKDATFNKNFFEDFQTLLKKHPPRDGTQITSFELCDFRAMYEHFEAERAKKKALSSAEKKELKKAKDEAEAKYTACLLDGRKEKIGNFRVEPPGLFRGRGDHPRKGALKFRVGPEDITLNIGKDALVPVPNVPGKWKKIIHDQTVTWLANWTENVNGNHKYVFLAAGSSLKGQSDMSKFEKARELKKHVEAIRLEYTNDLKSKVMADRQRATAMYFIDRLALRAGNEKGEDEADTVGCCSLRCEHVTLEAPHFIVFDFLGKDSIRYYNRVVVSTQVFKNIRIFKDNKTDEDNLFDRVNTSSLNKYLNAKMKGLTAKVFRTYNASITFQEQLDNNTPENVSVQEKLNAYNQANRMVAKLCNHQRSVPKTHEQSMEKMKFRIRGLKYERMKLRHALFGLEPKYKKNKKYTADESDIDDDWVATYEDDMKAKEIEKAEKKFAKENEKLESEGQKPQKESVLKEKIESIEEEFNRLEEERGTGKAKLKRERAPEKLEEQIQKLDEKIRTFKLQMEDRDAGKEVALGTSKINYLDPRITAAWCTTHEVPIEKLFSKSLIVKFPWALEVDNDWKF